MGLGLFVADITTTTRVAASFGVGIKQAVVGPTFTRSFRMIDTVPRPIKLLWRCTDAWSFVHHSLVEFEIRRPVSSFKRLTRGLIRSLQEMSLDS